MNRTPKKIGAFTLIELLIVVAIIAILAAIAVPNFLEAQMRAKNASVRNDFRTLLLAENAYRIDWNRFPPEELKTSSNTTFTDPNDLDYANFCVLTTPVAYLGSVPTNPFFEQTATSHFKNYTCWGIKAAQYTNPPDPNANGTYIFPAQGIFLHIISMGPDKVRQLSSGGTPSPLHQSATRGYAFVNCLYDPSNGTVSRGDFHCTNLGQTY